eukprot:1140748-Pelagomonas_calceolata.AAC.2
MGQGASLPQIASTDYCASPATDRSHTTHTHIHAAAIRCKRRSSRRGPTSPCGGQSPCCAGSTVRDTAAGLAAAAADCYGGSLIACSQWLTLLPQHVAAGPAAAAAAAAAAKRLSRRRCLGVTGLVEALSGARHQDRWDPQWFGARHQLLPCLYILELKHTYHSQDSFKGCVQKGTLCISHASSSSLKLLQAHHTHSAPSCRKLQPLPALQRSSLIALVRSCGAFDVCEASKGCVDTRPWPALRHSNLDAVPMLDTNATFASLTTTSNVTQSCACSCVPASLCSNVPASLSSNVPASLSSNVPAYLCNYMPAPFCNCVPAP